ncbi:MAG: DUF4147 domain-containing protein, partial [Granulicella sp.]
MSAALRAVARKIFAQAMAAVNVSGAVRKEISIAGGQLWLSGKAIRVSDLDHVLIVAIGKAAVTMHAAAAEQLASVSCHAIVVAPFETLPFSRYAVDGSVAFLSGAHPTPTADSVNAAYAIMQLLSRANARTAVLFLISGGASAMVELPLDPAITLADVAAFHLALVSSGLPIASMNTLRKHLSAVKGGRLAVAAAAAAMQCTLLVSDVPAASPDS